MTAPVRRILVLVGCLALLGTSISGASVANATETPDLPMELGDRGDGVRQVQSMLATLGHDPGPIDGIFGPLTEGAVESFQSQEALEVTGVVDQATWDAVVAALPEILMERGDRGEDVRTLQQLLQSAGFDPGGIDGIFGPLTESAVMSFQGARGLPVTGQVDQTTWDALNADLPQILMERGDRGDDVRSLQEMLSASGFSPGPIDGIFGSLTESAVRSFQAAYDLPETGKVDQTTFDTIVDASGSDPTLLERGDSGPDVQSFQQKLNDVGFSPGPIDGIFGSMTEAAVRAFQHVHGIEGDGSVTQATLDLLEELLPQANSAFSYGYDPNAGPEQWRDLITDLFSQVGLNEEKCGTEDRSDDCIGPQIENAMTIMVCESDGIPMAVNWTSGTTGLFQHHPDFWSVRVDRARALFPAIPSDATPYNPEHNIMVAALLVHESRDALIGANSLTGPWDDGPEPWGHWVSSSRNCADPPLVDP